MSTSRMEKLKQIQNGESETVVENRDTQTLKKKAIVDSSFAMFLKVFGVSIAAIGFIVGVVIGGDTRDGFEFSLAVVYWFSGLISGVFFISIGVITQLLFELNERQKIKT